MLFPRTTLEKMSKSELIALVLSQGEQLLAQGEQIRMQSEQIRMQSEQIRVQGERIKALEKRVEELSRKNARSAAPFSKNKPKQDPQKPGRKTGKGQFENRLAPDESEMTQLEIVEVPLDACRCGGELEAHGSELVSVTDIPPKPKVEIKGYLIGIKICKKCGKKHRGTHPDVAADQYGATAHRIGDRLISVGHCLHYGDGIPQRKVVGVLKRLTGIEVTQGMLSQSSVKQGCELGYVNQASESIRKGMANSERINTDDTGWRTGGKGTFLMGFETPDAVYYQIRDRHRNEEVREVIPSNYEGVMCTDRGKSYDAKELRDVKQQKCLSHIQRNLTEVEEVKTGKVKWFSVKLKH